MGRTRHLGTAAAIIALAALLTSCADDATSAGEGAGTVTTAESDLGTILVDADGFTLYLFQQDTGSASTCEGDCATTWPPLVADGQATAGDGASADLGTIARDDGTRQVTYAGHPLYRYSGDMAAGESNGQGLGDAWFAVAPDGAAVTTVAPSEDPYDRGGYG